MFDTCSFHLRICDTSLLPISSFPPFHPLPMEAAQLESALTTHAPLAWMLPVLAVADGHFEQERNEL